MRFQPKTEEQIERDGLLPEGEYPFTVIKAENAQSKSGNDMIKLHLRVYGPDDRAPIVFDYILEAMQRKLRHFCEHVGLLDKYEAGTLEAEDCENREGFLQLEIQEGKGGFSAKNNVADYGKAKPKEAKAAASMPSTKAADKPALADDDIPF